MAILASDPPGTRFLDPLALLLGPMLGLCSPHVGPMLAVVGHLRAFWSVLGMILSLS